MFFTYPQSRVEWEGNEKIDPFTDRIFKRLINQSIIVEQATLGKPTICNPSIREKRAVFLDWAILIAVSKNIFNLYKKSEINDWDEFEENNKKNNYQFVSSEWIAKTLKEVIISNRNKILIQIEAARIIIKKFKPKLIIENTSYNSGTMALNYVAKNFSIPIIELQHGNITRLHLGYIYFFPENQTNKILPNKILVYGDFSKKVILETSNAFSPEEIKVVGSLRLDKFLNNNRFEKETIRRELRKKLGIDSDDFLITVTSDPLFSKFFLKFLKEALPLLEGKIKIFIKLHPMDIEKKEKRIYKEIIGRFSVKILTDDMVDLYQLLISSDLHVTIYSTVFLECFALGVPNIIIDAENKFTFHFPEIANSKKIIMVNNPNDFVNKVKELIRDDDLRISYINIGKELSNYFFNVEETAEENIIKEINKFI